MTYQARRSDHSSSCSTEQVAEPSSASSPQITHSAGRVHQSAIVSSRVRMEGRLPHARTH